MKIKKKFYILYFVLFLILAFITETKAYTKSSKTYKETIKIDIPASNNAKIISYSKLKEGTRFCVYGPFYGNNNDYIKVSLKNDVKTNIIVATYGKSDVRSGDTISNIANTGYTLKGKVKATTKDGKYYIFVGAKDFKNLRGTLKIYTNNKQEEDKKYTYTENNNIINNFNTAEDMKRWFENNKNHQNKATIINNINENYSKSLENNIRQWIKENKNLFNDNNIIIYLGGVEIQ